METRNRKIEHIDICLNQDVEYRKTNGFEKYEFEHNALPELDFEKIDTTATFMGKRFTAPIIIEAITGGSPESGRINKNLAAAAQKVGIGMGIGSQRAALEDPTLAGTYEVRDVAPDIFLMGNIGGAQISKYSEKLKELTGMIGADALAVHLNTGQEMAQKEGNRNFENILANIKNAADSGIPVIIKEVGCGLSGRVARRLEDAGVSAIDVAGSGGTSWIKVDYLRGEKAMENFLEWGIPTAECLEQCREQKIQVPVIASGGVRNGLEVAKAVVMGASLAGMALPLLKPANESAEAVVEKLETMIKELRTAMLLVGAGNIEQLRNTRIRHI